MSDIFIAALSSKMALSLRDGAVPLNTIELTMIADLILATGRKELVPDLNRCAGRIGWGMLPQMTKSLEGGPPRLAVDVFQKYREAGVITWTDERVAA